MESKLHQGVPLSPYCATQEGGGSPAKWIARMAPCGKIQGQGECRPAAEDTNRTEGRLMNPESSPLIIVLAAWMSGGAVTLQLEVDPCQT
jgi:hypothetical protein